MPRYFDFATFAVFLSLLVYVFWTWRQWIASKVDDVPKWRFVASGAALLCATISTGFSEFMYVHAAYTGGYPLHHPVEMVCIQYGFFSALLGSLISIMGKGITRIHVLAISLVNLALWYVDGMAQ